MNKKLIFLLLIINVIFININTFSYAGEYIERHSLKYDWQVFRYNSRLVNSEIDDNIVKLEEEVFESESINTNEWNEDTIKYSDNIYDFEKLEEINSEKANNSLPTELKNNPIEWLISDRNFDEEKYFTDITYKNYPDVKINKIDFVETTVSNKFIIYADGPISSLDYFLWDGKYIIDIHGAVYNLDDEEGIYILTYEDNSVVTSVRSSQQEPDLKGRDVLRVVFDLKNPNTNFNLYLNSDRTQIILEMATQKLFGVELGQNSEGDYIKLTGSISPQVEVSRLSNPDRLIFDIVNTISMLGYQSREDIDGQYVTGIRTAQLDESTTRVVIDTDGQPIYEINYIDRYTTLIQLKEPSYKNIKYINYDNPIIILEGIGQNVDLSQIIYEDRYMDREYVIILPKNYEEIFGKGGVQVNDDSIDYIDITNDINGNTKLIIKSKGVYEYRIESDGEKIYIKAYKPRELYSKIVVVDPGHGGEDPGAIANGIREKDINLNITKYLKELFDVDNDIKVYYTRLDDIYPSLQQRIDLANEIEADFFLSIHNNSIKDIPNYSMINGTETHYYNDGDKPGLNSIKLAQIFQNYMINEIGLYNRGIKENNGLFVLRKTEMPAILIECGFLTNEKDVAKLTDPEIQRKIGKALYEATLEVFRKYPTGP